jgi:3-oxoacyl-[acyl-carrier-protein] synthase-3
MSVLEYPRVAITALSACVPQNEMQVVDLGIFTPEQAEKFSETTGIISQRRALPGVTASDLCFSAAEKLLNETGCDRSSIDGLIFISQTHDFYSMPSTGVSLQNRLGLPKTTFAFDSNLGCSGFVYGLFMAASFLQNPSLRKILLLCGDTITKTVSPSDPATYPLFGDAGSAALIERADNATPMRFNLFSDGSGWKHLYIRAGNRNSEAISREPYLWEDGVMRSDFDIFMDGLEIFNFSISQVASAIRQLLEACGLTSADVSYFVMHQANKMMLNLIRKGLKAGPEKLPLSLPQFGNTSSASIPVTLVTQLKDRLTPQDKLMLSGFGVGLSWANCILEAGNIKLIPLMEI